MYYVKTYKQLVHVNEPFIPCTHIHTRTWARRATTRIAVLLTEMQSRCALVLMFVHMVSLFIYLFTMRPHESCTLAVHCMNVCIHLSTDTCDIARHIHIHIIRSIPSIFHGPLFLCILVVGFVFCASAFNYIFSLFLLVSSLVCFHTAHKKKTNKKCQRNAELTVFFTDATRQLDEGAQRLSAVKSTKRAAEMRTDSENNIFAVFFFFKKALYVGKLCFSVKTFSLFYLSLTLLSFYSNDIWWKSGSFIHNRPTDDQQRNNTMNLLVQPMICLIAYTRNRQ